MDAGYLHFLRAYLTLSSESSLLQSGPDALNATRVLRVAVGVAAHALMLLHQGVVHEALGNTETFTTLVQMLVHTDCEIPPSFLLIYTTAV